MNSLGKSPSQTACVSFSMSAEIMKPRGKMIKPNKAQFWDKLAALDKSTGLLGKVASFRE